MRFGSDDDHARWCARPEQVGEGVDQDKWRQVVDGEGRLDPVRREHPAGRKHPRVADQYVQPGVCGLHLGREPPDLCLHREVSHQHLEAVIAGGGGNRFPRDLASGPCAAVEEHGRALTRECLGRGTTNPAICPRDKTGFSLHDTPRIRCRSTGQNIATATAGLTPG